MSPARAAWLEGPARSWVVSQAYALWTIIVFALTFGFANGQIHDFPSLAFFLRESAFPLFMGLVFGGGPYVRAKQGADRVANTLPVTTGGSAVVQSSPAPEEATVELVPVPKV